MMRFKTWTQIFSSAQFLHLLNVCQLDNAIHFVLYIAFMFFLYTNNVMIRIYFLLECHILIYLCIRQHAVLLTKIKF
jgi:hypothetical protein